MTTLLFRLFSPPSAFFAWLIYLVVVTMVDDFVSADLLFSAATAGLAVISYLVWWLLVGPYFSYSAARVLETSQQESYMEEFRIKLIALTG